MGHFSWPVHGGSGFHCWPLDLEGSRKATHQFKPLEQAWDTYPTSSGQTKRYINEGRPGTALFWSSLTHTNNSPLNQHKSVRSVLIQPHTLQHLHLTYSTQWDISSTTSTNLVLAETPHTQHSLTHFTIENTLTLNIQNTLKISSATSNIRGNKYHFQGSIILALVKFSSIHKP